MRTRLLTLAATLILAALASAQVLIPLRAATDGGSAHAVTVVGHASVDVRATRVRFSATFMQQRGGADPFESIDRVVTALTQPSVSASCRSRQPSR
jgi:hypothetical protein